MPTATAAVSPRSDARRNHVQLVAAARELFAIAGVDASVEEISERAGVGIGTLYRHFATKEELIDAVLEDAFQEYAELADTALAHADAWVGFCGFLEAALALHASNRGLKDVVASGAHGLERVAAIRRRLQPLTGATRRTRSAGRSVAGGLHSAGRVASPVGRSRCDRTHRRYRSRDLAALSRLRARRRARRPVGPRPRNGRVVSHAEPGRQHYNVTFALLAVAGVSYALLQSLVAPALPDIQHALHTSENGGQLGADLLSAERVDRDAADRPARRHVRQGAPAGDRARAAVASAPSSPRSRRRSP